MRDGPTMPRYSKERLRSRHSTKFAGATMPRVWLALVSQIETMRSGSRYGIGSRTTPRTMLKMAEVAPMPSASASSAGTVKRGARTKARTA